jgi:anthranilate phosphoribosyltransferase
MPAMLSDLTPAIERGRELTAAEISAAATALLRDDPAAVDAKANFLRALARRGETPAELTGFVREFLGHAVVPPLDLTALDRPAIDVCGTGGDKLGLFNVSTTAMFVLAGAGVAVVKHGNRGITSPSGSADVLAALGGKIDLAPDRFAEGIRRTGVAFMLAPHYHPAFKAVAPVRQKLAAEGQRTMFNLIGPLLNPVQPAYQIAGVYDRTLVPTYATILAGLGRTRAWAVHGETADGRGMDELSTLGPNHVVEAAGGAVTAIAVTSPLPRPASLNQLAGGDATTNAEILESLLRGETRGPRRDLVLLNAAAGLVVAGSAPDLVSALALAADTLDSGRALAVLEAWRAFA